MKFRVIGLLGIGLAFASNAWPAVAVSPTSRILMVAPHPDDEMLGTGAQIWSAQRAIERGDALDYRVLVMTCGDGYPSALEKWRGSGNAQDLNHDGKIDYLDLGYARHEETLNALAQLGVPSEKVIFLGYPDGGLEHLASSGGIYRDPLTLVSEVPYPFAYHFGASYTGVALLDDLEQVIRAFNPTLVYTPTPTDLHPDHAHTREFVKMALADVGFTGDHLEYLIHWEKSEPGWPHANENWQTPAGHIAADISSNLAELGWSRAEKRRLIGTYSTQMAVDGAYLVNFAKDSEVFWHTRPLISDYLKPKH